MHTTIALQPETHDRLLDLKRRRRLSSMDAVVRALLDAPVDSAQILFRRHEAEVRAICKTYGVTKLVAFGSRARGDARPDSDLDLAVNLPKGSSLFDQAGLMAEFERIFNLGVDLVTFGPHLGRLQARMDRDGVDLLG